MEFIQTPDDVMPAGNDINIVVNTDEPAKDNYSDTYRYTLTIVVDGNALATLEAVPDPTYGYGVFRISQILSSIVELQAPFEMEDRSTYILQQPNALKEVRFEIGDKFVAGSLNTRENIINTTIEVFNGSLPYPKYVDWSATSLGSGAGELTPFLEYHALKDYPNGGGKLYYHKIDYHNNAHHLFIEQYDASGALIRSDTVAETEIANAGRFLQMTVGPSQIRSDAGWNILNDNTRSYLVRLRREEEITIGSIWVNLKDSGKYKDSVARLYYTNRFGCYDSILFDMKNYENITTSRQQLASRPGTLTAGGVEYNSFDAGKVDYAVESKVRMDLNTDWMSDFEFDAAQDLIKSPEVYLFTEKYGYVRAIIKDNSFRVAKKENEKVNQLSISVEFSVSDNNILG